MSVCTGITLYLSNLPTEAVTSDVTLRPTSSIVSEWTQNGSSNGTCSGNCGFIDESATSPNDGNYVQGTADGAVDEYGLGPATTGGQRATQIKIRVRAKKNSGLANINYDINLRIGGVLQTAVNIPNTNISASFAWHEATFTGSWTQSEVDAASARLIKYRGAGFGSVWVATLEAIVTYESPVQNQNATRAYVNANSASPGSPLAATNTSADVPSSYPFRLRTGLTASDTTWVTGSWGAHGNQYKLQYALKNSGACSGTTGWSDVVSGSGPVRWNTNGSVSNGASIASIGANDPTTSGTKRYQTYHDSNTFTLATNTAVGETALWDFSLQTVSATVGASYCMRVVQSNNVVLNAYSAYSEIFIAPLQNQDATRLYENANSVSPGSPLAATNTSADRMNSTTFRARVGLTPSGTTWKTGTWGPHGNQYKLQYALKNSGTCSGTTGWSDVVSGSGNIRWYDNASVSDNATISSIGANDPTTSGTKRYQTYRESNPFTSIVSTASGETALWDFSLQTVGVTVNTSYCLRIIQNDGSPLNAYSAHPEILIVGDYSVAFVDGSGNEIASPTLNFSNITANTTDCTDSAVFFGSSNEKLRVTNDVLTNGWNVTIAATNGPTATWTAGAFEYDYNDYFSDNPLSDGCPDGSDDDSYGGIMAIVGEFGVITPKTGCSDSGLSMSVGDFFDEGTVDAITLLSADASSQRFCYWDVTNILIGQYVPKATQPGTYNLDMTVTMTAS